MKKSLIVLLASMFMAVTVLPAIAAPPADDPDGTNPEIRAQEEDAELSDDPHADEQHSAWEPQADDAGNGGEAAEHEGHGENEEPSLSMAPDLLRQFGGRLATAKAGVIRRQVSLPGEVQLNKETVAHITSEFPAKIVKVMAKTGDAVKAGEILAVAESSETLARFELKSLIDGVIIRRHITLGEHLTPDDTAFVVADLTTLWVDIALYPKQVPLVKPGQQTVLSTSHGPAPVETQIDYVAPVVDERTRTGLARIFLDNQEGSWKPGMFVTANITLDRYFAAVVVPKSAVIEVEDRPVVFVQEAERWVPRPVTLGREDKNSVAIVNGLQAGERYVSEGGFVLKAELQKSEFESGHNH